MRVLFDTNVLLDVTTLYYLGAKDLGRRRAHDQVRTLPAHAAGVGEEPCCSI